MDIGSLSMAMSQVSLQNDVSIAVCKMTLDNSQKISDEFDEMMGNLSSNPDLGKNIDVSV